MKFNNFIKSLRKQKGLTQQQLASALGYTSPQFVSNWERGVAFPPANIIGDLSGLLGVPQEELTRAIKAAKIQKAIEGVERSFR